MAVTIPPSPLKKINYLSKDFSLLRDELFQRLPIITKGKWTNYNESDPGVALLEVFCSMVDNLLFYQDQMANEIYLPTARQRNNVIKLLRLLGYEFNSVTASEGTVTVTPQVGSSPVFPITITSGTQFSAQSPTTNKTLIFTATQGVQLNSGVDVKTIPVIQGSSVTESFVSDGSPSQRFIMSNTSIDKNTVKVSVSTSPLDNTSTVEWTTVVSFYESTFNDTHFKIEIDEFSRVSIVFGDGQFGMIPPVDTQIIVVYVITDGASGNVGQGAISTVVSSIPFIQDNAQNTVALTITDSLATAGGADIESIEHAKQTALGLLFGLNRALSRQDYEALMTSVAGVDKAVAWGENEESNPDYRLFNKVRVSFFSQNLADMYYNPASRASYRTLRDLSVKPLLLEKMPITTRLVFVDPIFIDIFVTLTIGIDILLFDPNIVIDALKTNILDYYSYDNIYFGLDVRVSDLLSIANRTEGVTWAIVNRLGTTPSTMVPDVSPQPPMDIILNKWELPVFTDTTNLPSTTPNATIATPYLQVKIPVASSIGLNDVTIINPDEQSNALVNSFLYFPSPSDKHIIINYVTTQDQSGPFGGFLGGVDYPDAPIYMSSS